VSSVWQSDPVERGAFDPDPLPGPDALDDVLGGNLGARLEQWAADARIDHSARRRMRERWLRQQAEEEGHLIGAVTDLGERAVPTSVHTLSGRVHHGRIRFVGRDFLAIAGEPSGEVFVALDAVASVRSRPGRPATIGDRTVSTRLHLAEVLAGLAAQRERVLLVTGHHASAIAGTLLAIGHDVVTLRLEGADHAGTAYVPLAAISEVIL
jgi:hypothetical protein